MWRLRKDFQNQRRFDKAQEDTHGKEDSSLSDQH